MSDLSKGDIPVLILAVLAEGALHGYAIARHIERRSSGGLSLREGSLYPALRTLEHEGCIKSAWEVQPSGPARRVYRLTAKGRTQLAKRQQAWQDYVRTVESILQGTKAGIKGAGNAQTA